MLAAPLTWQRARIHRIQQLTPTIRRFELAPAEPARPWAPGGHLPIRVRIDGQDVERTYSLVPADEDGHYAIAVKLAEPSRGGSRYLWSLAEGDTVGIADPRNHFPLSPTAPEYLLLAGGIGITPLVGMARALAQRGAKARMIYAARNAEELAYAELLRELLGQEAVAVYLDEKGERADLAGHIAALAPNAEAYVCGPLGMLDAMRAAWAASGRAIDQLRFETFGNSGRAAAQSFTVELPRHNLRIDVPAESTLLDALNAAGVELLSDCKRGECGLCAIDVISHDTPIDHRDVYFSDEEHQHSARMCACVSRATGGVLVLDSPYRPDTLPKAGAHA